jgi:hypothetical protein
MALKLFLKVSKQLFEPGPWILINTDIKQKIQTNTMGKFSSHLALGLMLL